MEPIIPVEPIIPLAVVSAIPTVAGPTLHATAGVPFSGVVGFFASPVLDPPDAYSASVKWGDGGNSNATVSLGEYNGQFGYVISATHTYAKPGTDSVKVTLFEGPINPASTLPTRTVETFVDKAIVQTSTAVPILASASALLEIHEPAQHLVIRNAAQLKADTGLFEAGLAAMLKVGSINWKTQMLVVVTGGFGGVSFLSPSPKITSLTDQRGRLTVHWESVEQNPNQPIPQYVILRESRRGSS